MKTEIAFDIDLQDYSVRRLSLENIGAVQVLFEKCLDYMLLVDGHPADPKAVEEEFISGPPGKSPDDKFVFGIVNQQNDLVGLLDAIRGYPDETTWWIGLLIFTPEIRSQGLGQKVTEGFAEHVRANGGQAIMLGVVAENERAYKFWNRLGFELVRTTEPQQFGNKTQSVSVMRRILPEVKLPIESKESENAMSHYVRDFYNSNAAREWERLDLPLCKIEFASTLWLIDKYFPKQGHICDIGGGPGRYTIELIRRGYAVTLFDLSDEEIQLARRQLDKLGLTAEGLIVGDARDMIALATECCEAALLLGPMYHIVEPDERVKVLQELKRILKPQGIAIIAYLNSWGLMRTGIVDFAHWYRDISTLRSMLDEHTFTGQSLSDFTESYWSTPKAALEEVRKAGLEVISYAGAESFAGGMGPLLERLAVDNPEAYENVVIVAAETCELEQYRDGTDHLHIVARKTLE